MAQTLHNSDFIKKLKSTETALLDVRSEKEFEKGHIPGAINLPLLNNEERHAIGTCYVKQGREPAVRLGFELTGHKFVQYIDKAKEISPTKEIFLYCWRGGMRSNIMAWLLNMAGFKVIILKGGYKSYRNWALQQFTRTFKILILGGKTGTGKTEILLQLKNYGEQVIDLEKLANHKGSVFGGLGQLPQHTQEHFENLLAYELSFIDANKNLWLENESRLIGYLKIPDLLFNQMRETDLIEVNRDTEFRKQRILIEYSHFDKELLIEKTLRLEKKLGGLNLKNAINYLAENDFENWARMMLNYYDEKYTYSNSLREKKQPVNYVYNENIEIKENAVNLISLCKKHFQ